MGDAADGVAVDPEHLGVRGESLHGGPDPRDESTAPHGHEDSLDLREIVDDLQADRPLSRDRGRVCEGVDEGRGPRFPSLFLVGVDQVLTGDGGHVRSFGGDRLDLTAHGSFRDADRAIQPESAGRPGDGQAMVP